MNELLFNLNLVVYSKWEQVMILILINVFLTFILFPFYFEQSHYFDGSLKIGGGHALWQNHNEFQKFSLKIKLWEQKLKNSNIIVVFQLLFLFRHVELNLEISFFNISNNVENVYFWIR